MQSNLPANSPPSRPTSTALSPGLKALLELEPNDNRAVGGIRQGFAEEVRSALPALRAAAVEPSGEAGVSRVVGARFGLFSQPERSPEEWGAWWGDYFNTLADLPESAIEAGMQAWVRQLDAEFMPKPGQLRELALKTPNRAARALERAMQAVEVKPLIAAPTVAPVERASVADLMADFSAKMAAKRPPVAAPKNFPPPPVDEHGISDAMRRHLDGGE